MQKQQLRMAIDKINSSEVKDVAIVMHNKPDGDSIGSAVALEEMLILLGKKVDLIIHNKINKRYAPIIGENRVEKIIVPPIGKLYDLLIMVDFSDPDRTIQNIKRISKEIMVLDHHLYNQSYGDIYVCMEYASTGMIVFEIIENTSTVTTTIANAIYMTIVSDTNGFKNNNTDYLAHEVASKLINYGADINRINQIFEDKSLEYIKLMGNTLSKVKFDNRYKITYLVVTREDILASRVKGEEVSQLVDEIRWTHDGDITFLFIEGINNIRISARSKFTPINKILEKFGGGGHQKAAGCAIEHADLNHVVNEVLHYTKTFIDKNKNMKK